MWQRWVVFCLRQAMASSQKAPKVATRRWSEAVSLGKPLPASAQQAGRLRAVARFMEGSEFFNLGLKIGNRERVLNRNRSEPVEQTLKRLRLATVASAMVNGVKANQGSVTAGEHPQPIAVSLYNKGGEQISEGTVNEQAWREAETLSIGDVTYSVLVNPPSVLAVVLPDVVLVGFPVQPTAHLEFCHLSNCRIRWLVKRRASDVSGEDLMEVGTGQTFTPRAEDENALLSVELTPVGEDGTEGLPLRIAPLTRITAAPPDMLFTQRQTQTSSFHDVGSGFLRVMTYNTLSEMYCMTSGTKDFMFSYCAPQALEFGYRSQILLAEIRGYHADLLCMQEVDKRHFQNFFLPQLKAVGYDGVFQAKNKVLEGCALFWRSERLKLKQEFNFFLKDRLNVQSWWEKVVPVKSVEGIIRTRTTVLQCAELECDGQRLLVANTHLYYHGAARHIRLLQAAVITDILTDLQSQLSVGSTSPVPVILCGDLNSHTDTGVFEYLSSGRVSKEHPDWVLNQNVDNCVRFDFQHNLQLDSAAPAGCLPYTNFVQSFEGVLDYVFFDRRAFSVRSLVPVPDRHTVTKYTALPSVVHPSDHLAVVADLEWTK